MTWFDDYHYKRDAPAHQLPNKSLRCCHLLLLDRVTWRPGWWRHEINGASRFECGLKILYSGFAHVREPRRSRLAEHVVSLRAAEHRDVVDFECPSAPQTVWLERHIASNNRMRFLMTHLFDAAHFAGGPFADLYHQRWRIEDGFKHRLNWEHVSGLSQLTMVRDVAAKMLCDNLQALTALSAHDNADLSQSAGIKRACVQTASKPLLPALLLRKKVAKKLLRMVLHLVAKHTYTQQENLSKPCNLRPKLHKYMAQIHC